MAFEMEGLNQKRQQREQREQARRQQEKKARIKLFAALVVLVTCGILIAVMALGRQSVSVGETTLSTPGTEQQVSGTETQNTEDGVRGEPTTVIRFAAAGDLNVTDQVVASGRANYDYTHMILDVLPLLSEADLTALNLEGNVCGLPYGKDSAPPQLLETIKAAGVDFIQLANSKAINKGISGLNATIQSVRNAGLATVGVIAEGESYKDSYVIRVVQGVRVAVVAFTKGMDGMALPTGSEDRVNLLYTDYATTYKKVDKNYITKVLRAVAEEQPDITIAMVHWGSEYSDIHSDTQEAIRNLMLKEGVDAIIGSHPHYVQEMQLDAENGTFVAYSLGDFLGDADRTGTDYSIVLELEITKDNETGITKVTDFSYTPIYIARDADGTLRVVRLEAAIKAFDEGHIDRVTKECYDNMIYGLSRIEERVNPKQEQE